MTEKASIKKLMVANRSEIATRVFRSSHELGIRTVAIYSHEDRFALHRFKADEAYQIGTPGEPIRSYLDIEGIVKVAKTYEIDAIHPGYGFLSENASFAKACRDAGIIFVGPRTDILEHLGDKVVARSLAKKAGAPVLSGSDNAISDDEKAHELAEELGYPVIVKAAMGGGGRGMRVANSKDKLQQALDEARREAGTAFGAADVFLEKFVRHARHIEVQLLGDHHGNLVHLFERDCSLQRRHQKIVEIAPGYQIEPKVRQGILDAAIAVGNAVKLNNAGTVEFLLDADTGEFYFIEVNPRIQVEHTVTEQVTGYDIVKSQILISQGTPLSDEEIGLGDQSAVKTTGFAIQCRVTTEDPTNNFMPDYGRLTTYRSSGGPGLRLDAGSAFAGTVITPFYDSMLVKVTATGLRFVDAARRMERALQEFRIRGVKTNIPFLINLITHEKFLAGGCTTRFIDERPELFTFKPRRDRATKVLSYIAEVIVNGHPEVKGATPPAIDLTPAPAFPVPAELPKGTRDRFLELGPEKFSQWIREENRLLLTDTTFRDAHQSLLATRMRTFDMLEAAPRYAVQHADLFSLEMWGGATFDASMRFLKESPWDRLTRMRERIPNILFQMLLRSANAVGYTNYPDNVVYAFVDEAAKNGIDLFRIFDACNWLPNLELGIEAVLKTGKLAEAAICYTGDILDPRRDKYTLKYYIDLAKELEKRGAHILAIKDMAGLCKPHAAQLLVRALRQEISLPIHFHTHDTPGGQIASLLMAAEENVDIVDAAMAPFSGLTSQPNLHALVSMMQFHPRSTGLESETLQKTADYWTHIRKYYRAFETGQLSPMADVYENEMPGGQATNLYQQASALGLRDRWTEVCQMYREVNQLFGDIIKVTPTSKVVGDMALFMVSNNLTPNDVKDGQREIAFPESVVELFEGKLGLLPGGFPEELQKKVLRGRKPIEGRPGASLEPADFDAKRQEIEKQLKRTVTDKEVVSALLYPRVFIDFAKHQAEHSDTSIIPTPTFFYGMEPGEEVSVDIEVGKTLIIKFLTVGDPHIDGTRTVFFELNGQPREVRILDRTLAIEERKALKAEPDNPNHLGAPMPGLVSQVAVQAGEEVREGQKLLTLEAMKMETTLYAEKSGKLAEVHVQAGSQVETGDLLICYEG